MRHFTIEDLREVMARYDGTELGAVMMLTGFTAEQIDDLGGMPDER